MEGVIESLRLLKKPVGVLVNEEEAVGVAVEEDEEVEVGKVEVVEATTAFVFSSFCCKKGVSWSFPGGTGAGEG